MTVHSRTYWMPKWHALMQARLAKERAEEAALDERMTVALNRALSRRPA